MALTPTASPPSTAQIAELLSTHQNRTVDPQYLYLAPALSFPGLLAVGEQVTTHSADLQAVVLWDAHGAQLGDASEMVAKAMARAGWNEADEKRRQSLAMGWVRYVELQFAGLIQDESLAVFGVRGRPSFHPPTALSLPDGGVAVKLWFCEVERGKSSTREFCNLRISFTAEGLIADRDHRACFSVPNQEWRKAL